jgi:hypothetical protein
MFVRGTHRLGIEFGMCAYFIYLCMGFVLFFVGLFRFTIERTPTLARDRAQTAFYTLSKKQDILSIA